VASGGLTIHQVSGTHADMIFEPHVDTLAVTFVRCLDAAWEAAHDSTSSARGADGSGDHAA
jgi:thioesterase domain-containing protein